MSSWLKLLHSVTEVREAEASYHIVLQPKTKSIGQIKPAQLGGWGAHCNTHILPLLYIAYPVRKTKRCNIHSIIASIAPGVTTQLSAQVPNTFPFQVTRRETRRTQPSDSFNKQSVCSVQRFTHLIFQQQPCLL